MLKQAILYEEQLKRKYIEAVCDDYFKYYFDSCREFSLKIYDSDYWTIQMVSIDKNNNIIGFISVNMNYNSRVANRFGIMNFTKTPNITFAIDVIKFLRDLRDKYDVSKFEFMAFVGAPAEMMYQKFIKRHGGRVVGTYKNSTKLVDGKYYDSRMFEIMREDMNF